MRKLIDANVILRYLLGDHPQMSEEARQIIEGGAFSLPEVICYEMLCHEYIQKSPLDC